MAHPRITRAHRVLAGIVLAGAVLIAGIGFAGSYGAVRNLAYHKGFGAFSNVIPVGVDAGIIVLLALDLLLTWLRIPFPLLRQSAWALTAATVVFNASTAWPDPVGVGMHAIAPLLFVVIVEAARHAVGRIADLTADRHMDSVRFVRWLLAPYSTAKLWRIMKLWELRSYDTAIGHERSKLIYQAHLSAQFGPDWRRKAPVQTLLPLRLARYGVPLAETAGAGLAAAGIDPAVLPPAVHGLRHGGEALPSAPSRRPQAGAPGTDPGAAAGRPLWLPAPAAHDQAAYDPSVHDPSVQPWDRPQNVPSHGSPDAPSDDPRAEDSGAAGQTTAPDRYYAAWRRYIARHGEEPSGDQLSAWLAEHNVMGRHGNPVSPGNLRRYLPEFRYYEAWRRHADEYGETLTAAELSDHLARVGIPRNGERVPAEVLESMLPDFHRRRAVESALAL
ncbi:DUF2637 domain-containing protein [Streptomyces sp. NPDC001380]|uniref:DUF2637 domain-containing protein n=1 Tax=Streptomyces sp. NPDC001380 TaxID=3364566 RepID=UPI0036C3ED07